jgi:hypothetical protein
MPLSTYVLVPPFLPFSEGLSQTKYLEYPAFVLLHCALCSINYHNLFFFFFFFFWVLSLLKIVGNRRYSVMPNLVYREAVSVVQHCIYLLIVSQAWLVHSHGFVTCCKSSFIAIYSLLINESVNTY